MFSYLEGKHKGSVSFTPPKFEGVSPTVSMPLSSTADFLGAHNAYLANDAVRLGRYAQRLKNTPLEVYVSYYQLSVGLKNADPKTVRSFLSRPEDTPVIDQLRGEWLKLLGKKQQWDLFDAEYPRLLNEDAELACYALQSHRRSQGSAVLREVRKLWFTDKGQPESCSTLFEAALAAGVISDPDIKRRLRLALEGNNVSLAIMLAKRLDGNHSTLPGMLQSASADPDRYLKKLTQEKSRSTNRTVAKSSRALTPQARVDGAIRNRVSCVEQLPFSLGSLENPISSPGTTIALPPEQELSLANLFLPLGYRKAENLLSALDAGKIYLLSAPAIQSNPGSTLSLPDTQRTGATGASRNPPATSQGGGPSVGDAGAECIAPCVIGSESDLAAPASLNPRLASEGRRAVALFALQRLAKQSPDLAIARWAKIAGYFPVAEQRYFYGRLAYEAARNLDVRALRWYKAAADTPLDDHQSAWRVRAALRALDWPEVLASINAMADQQQHDPAWQYWKARALKALGRPIEAREIFAPLSNDFNFYGQLASAELADSPILSKTTPVYKPSQRDITEMLALPGIQRTLALYRMSLRTEALDEWRWVLRNLNDRELLAAAEIARRNEMYDRAIGAAEKTVNLHDFSLRYLAPYRSELQAHIREHGLDEAWVYGLMRQESRFATSAKSETGASGLMQVMPSTARWIARKLGLKSYRNALIHQLDTNLRLGTYYMKSVLSQSENNPVLASAAYNAGPARALQWRGDQPLEGAIYAETIPFEETRDYVKKVMSNTVYYADQFGSAPLSLKQRLGIIPARPATYKTALNQPTIPNAE